MQALLNAVRSALTDMSPAMEVAGRVWQSNTQQGFRQGVDPWGKRWRPLRSRRGQPLRDTGRLQRSIVARSDPKGFDLGSNVCYLIAHQFGAVVRADQPAGRASLCGYVTKGSRYLRWRTRDGKYHAAKQVTIPRRAVLPITEQGNIDPPKDWITDLVQTVNDYLSDSLQ